MSRVIGIAIAVLALAAIAAADFAQPLRSKYDVVNGRGTLRKPFRTPEHEKFIEKQEKEQVRCVLPCLLSNRWIN